jgi:hypothetical protein
MNIELYSLLATVILLTSIATVVFAFVTYVLFRIREARKLKKKPAGHGPAETVATVGEKPVDPVAEAQPLPELAARPRFFKPYEPVH